MYIVYIVLKIFLQKREGGLSPYYLLIVTGFVRNLAVIEHRTFRQVVFALSTHWSDTARNALVLYLLQLQKYFSCVVYLFFQVERGIKTVSRKTLEFDPESENL